MSSIIGMLIHDKARLLPPDAQGRPRWLDKIGNVKVKCGRGHPLDTGNGYCQEGRLVLFELDRLMPGDRVFHRDRDKQNNHPDNLVALAKGDPFPWENKANPHPCLCGCGETLMRKQKYVKGHKKSMNPFNHLPVTRERKRQLWNRSRGLCERCGCQRVGHRSMCPRCLSKREENAIRKREAYYRENREHILSASRRWGNKNRARQAEYQANMRVYGRKHTWPLEVRQDWDAKYPTAGQRHISQLGLRYER